MTRLPQTTCWLLVAGLLLGCQPASQTPAPSAAQTGAAETASSAPPTTAQQEPVSASSSATGKVTTELATWPDVQKFIANQPGKIVVLDVWSTYCPPCLKELPGLAKLQQKYPEDVVCVSFNTNYYGDGQPTDELPAIQAQLEKVSATYRNFVSTQESEATFTAMGIVSIPVVQVYGRDGKLSRQFDESQGAYGPHGFTYAEHIEPLVASLVAQPQP